MKILNSILFALVALFGFVHSATAHEGHDHSQAPSLSACTTVQEKINRTIIRYNDQGLKQKDQFHQLQADLEQIKAYLQSQGADTTELEQQLPILDTKIDTFDSNIALFVTKLQEAQQFPCTTTNGKFKAELQLGRAQQEVIRKDLYEVREFYLKEIKPSLLRSYSQL